MPLSLSEQLVHSTVRIECDRADGATSTGTGFFYSVAGEGDQFMPLVFTNKHVVAAGVTGRFTLTGRDNSDEPDFSRKINVVIPAFEGAWFMHPDPDVDLCAMPIAWLLEQTSQNNDPAFVISLDQNLLPNAEDVDDFGAIEDIVMVGYPNGIWDATNNMPIVRRGVTATHPRRDYEGRKEFMIDAACFPGSSGSPVFLYNVGGWAKRDGGMIMGGSRIKLLGVLYAGPVHNAEGEIRIVTVPTEQKAVAFSRIPNNLGLVIKSERVRELADIIKERVRALSQGGVGG